MVVQKRNGTARNGLLLRRYFSMASYQINIKNRFVQLYLRDCLMGVRV